MSGPSAGDMASGFALRLPEALSTREVAVAVGEIATAESPVGGGWRA